MITIITGHYGSGKTEVALHLAQSLHVPTIIDLDIVNPYFRTKDAEQLLVDKGIRLIAPLYANTNVDLPALPADIFGAIQGEGDVVIDVGGDDAGAIALGQYRAHLAQKEHEVICVVNAKRPRTQTAEDVIAMIRSIEAASRLQVTALINNTHLKEVTTVADVMEGQGIIEEVMAQTGLPQRAIAARADVAAQLDTDIPVLPLTLQLMLPWE